VSSAAFPPLSIASFQLAAKTHFIPHPIDKLSAFPTFFNCWSFWGSSKAKQLTFSQQNSRFRLIKCKAVPLDALDGVVCFDVGLSRLSNVSRKMGKCQFFIAICLIVMNA
jgi:hypothetical protein